MLHDPRCRVAFPATPCGQRRGAFTLDRYRSVGEIIW
jgi:hypothetical protein